MRISAKQVKFPEFELGKELSFGPFKTYYCLSNAPLKPAFNELVIDGNGCRTVRCPYTTVFVRIPCTGTSIKGAPGNVWKYDINSYASSGLNPHEKIIDHVIFSYDPTSTMGVWLPRQSVPSIFGYGVWTAFTTTFTREQTAFFDKHKEETKKKLDAKLKKLGLTLQEFNKQEKEREEKEASAKTLGTRLEVITSLKLIQSHIENAIKNLADERGTRDEAKIVYLDGSKLQALARKYRLQLPKEKRGNVLSRR
ncbi:MAG: hypothetical protein WC761_01300 [Candidatus Paceibacterota bacterium]|jgi:hypothetical protein